MLLIARGLVNEIAKFINNDKPEDAKEIVFELDELLIKVIDKL